MPVLNRRTDQIPADAIYIGRGSKWGNPFVMKSEADRDAVCEQFEHYMEQELMNGSVTLEELASLHGKSLVCFCAPKRCHGHSLEKGAAWAHHELYGGMSSVSAKHSPDSLQPDDVRGFPCKSTN